MGEGSNAKSLIRGKGSLLLRLMHRVVGMFCCQPHARALNFLGKGGVRTPGCDSGTTLMLGVRHWSHGDARERNPPSCVHL